MTKILAVTALGAAFLTACGGSSGTTGASSGASSGAATGATSTSGAASTTGAGNGTGSTSSGGSGTPVTYCNGAELQAGTGGSAVYVATYPESDNIAFSDGGCSATLYALLDAGAVGSTWSTVAGVLDVDTYSSPSGLLTLYPATCDQLGAGSAATYPNAPGTAPSGASTIANARATSLDGGTVYGIVTFINSPYYDATDSKGEAGSLWLQDAPGSSGVAPMSGIQIYVPKSFATSTGIAGWPDGGKGFYVNVGDVIAISNLNWDPYKGEDELEYTSSSAVTYLGTSPLPPAVPLTSAQITTGDGGMFVGMIVSQSDTPDTLANVCPSNLESQSE